MERFYLTIGDFRKNSGIVGMLYLLNEAGAKEGISAQAIALLSTVADYNREDRLAFRGCGGCAGECPAL